MDFGTFIEAHRGQMVLLEGNNFSGRTRLLHHCVADRFQKAGLSTRFAAGDCEVTIPATGELIAYPPFIPLRVGVPEHLTAKK